VERQVYPQTCLSDRTIQTQLSVLVKYKLDIIIISFNVACSLHNISDNFDVKQQPLTHSSLKSIKVVTLNVLVRGQNSRVARVELFDIVFAQLQLLLVKFHLITPRCIINH